jgi:radial spoke head protein 1
MFIYPNKDVYSGSWLAGRKHGQGTYVFNATSMKYVGEWFEGKFLSGKWVYPNGTSFEGQFQNNKPKGAGVWHFANGNSLEGTYDQLITTADDNSLQTQLVWAHH